MKWQIKIVPNHQPDYQYISTILSCFLSSVSSFFRKFPIRHRHFDIGNSRLHTLDGRSGIPPNNKPPIFPEISQRRPWQSSGLVQTSFHWKWVIFRVNKLIYWRVKHSQWEIHWKCLPKKDFDPMSSGFPVDFQWISRLKKTSNQTAAGHWKSQSRPFGRSRIDHHTWASKCMVFLWFSYGFPMVFPWFSYEKTIKNMALSIKPWVFLYQAIGFVTFKGSFTREVGGQFHQQKSWLFDQGRWCSTYWWYRKPELFQI